MRISDWSSDVCSSDLSKKAASLKQDATTLKNQASTKARDAATKGKDKAAEAVGSLAKLLEDSAGTVDSKFGKQYGDYARSAASTVAGLATSLDKKDLDEIGRASCGERVCKSGEISGVGGSLKTNKYENQLCTDKTNTKHSN